MSFLEFEVKPIQGFLPTTKSYKEKQMHFLSSYATPLNQVVDCLTTVKFGKHLCFPHFQKSVPETEFSI